MEKFLGVPYPIVEHPRGFLRTQSGLQQIKADLLTLLLTNPGERVMLPDFGTPLNTILFDQNDLNTADAVRDMIIDAINAWEPRIAVEDIEITQGVSINTDDLNVLDTGDEKSSTMLIKIRFTTFDNIQEVSELKLEIPLSNGDLGSLNTNVG